MSASSELQIKQGTDERRLLTILFLSEFISPDGCELSLSLAVQGSWVETMLNYPHVLMGHCQRSGGWWWQDWIGSEWVFFYP